MNYKSILNAVAVVVAVTMVMLVGCGGDSNPSSGGGGGGGGGGGTGGGGGNLTGSGVAWMTGDCNSSCAGYFFKSNGTMDVIGYGRNSDYCVNVGGGHAWSANGNKVFLGTSEFGTISGNTLTLYNGSMYTRTTGIPCAN